MRKNTGGMAFPLMQSWRKYDDVYEVSGCYEGMTLRDYFAAKAMQGINWRLVDYGGNTKETMDRRINAEQAAWCYAIADAMIAEREKDEN